MIRCFAPIFLTVSLGFSLQAAAPSAEANAAFDRYVKIAEDQMNQHKGAYDFLWLDRHPDKRTVTWLGNITVRPQETLDHGKPIETPDGVIQHWYGAIYLDNAALDKVRDVVLNFAAYKDFVKDQVVDSKLIKHDGDHFDFEWRLYKKKLSAVLLNAKFTATYQLVDSARIRVDCLSTHIGEVEHPKNKKEWDTEKSPDDEAGYLQRLNLYWRLEQADNGVYVEVETISLGRQAGGLNPGRFIRGFETYPSQLTNGFMEGMRNAFPHRR